MTPNTSYPMADLPPNASLEDEDTVDADTKLLSSDTDEPEVDDNDIEELEDGSVIIHDKKKPEDREESEFDENLVEYFDSFEVSGLGRELCELIEADKEARTERDKQYAEGIKKTGLANNKNAGADFDGASSVVHPMLAKGCVDFASKAVKELFPSAGPVRTQIMGDQTDSKIDRAERKKTYMNWQLTSQIPEHRPEFEKMLSQLPLGGSQYKRWWYDQKLGRARTMAVYIDDIFLPFDQNDFYTTPRLTHREFIGITEFQSRVDSGLYESPDGAHAGESPERSDSAKASREVEGVTDDSAAYDKTGGTREVYTVYADLAFESDPLTKGEVAPYIIHVEEFGSKVLGIYRNWKESDEKQLKLHWIVEYNFIPWRGAYAIGLAHLIGSMSTASTGALNALLDSAHINNFPGGLKLKGGRSSGQSITVNATELREIDAPPGVDDIRKLVMAFPFNGPSNVLYQLMEWLTQQAEMVVSTASEKIADAGANMPMGTALALIEGGSTNFSAIHARLHHSARRELEILHRLNAVYLQDEETVEELGELIVYRDDFKGPMDILPVSDPNIFSEAQRYAQLQAVMQLEAMPEFKPFFKPEKLLIRALRLLQVPYAEDIANLPRDPKRLDPVDENAAAALDDGTPLKVYEEQDDLSHLESHVTFMTSPMLGASPIIGAAALPKLMAHCKEHLIAYYRKHHKAAAKAIDTVSKMQGFDLTPEQAQSKGHAFADKAMAAQLSTMVAPGLEQALKLMQQFAPKPPADGNTTASLAAQTQMAMSGHQAERQKLMLTSQVEDKRLQSELAFKAQESDKDRQYKLAIRKMELEAEFQREALDRELTRGTAQLAANIEKMQAENENRIAELTLMVQNQQMESGEENKRILAKMKEESDQALIVLKSMLEQQAVQADTKEAAKPDIATIIQPLLQSVQQNSQELAQYMAESSRMTAATLSQLADGMSALHKSHSAPRVAQYVRDPLGNVTGVKSTIESQE
jgi:hypothetical protein